MGRPNAMRSFAYCSASSKSACIAPDALRPLSTAATSSSPARVDGRVGDHDVVELDGTPVPGHVEAFERTHVTPGASVRTSKPVDAVFRSRRRAATCTPRRRRPPRSTPPGCRHRQRACTSAPSPPSTSPTPRRRTSSVITALAPPRRQRVDHDAVADERPGLETGAPLDRDQRASSTPLPDVDPPPWPRRRAARTTRARRRWRGRRRRRTCRRRRAAAPSPAGARTP